VLQLSLVDFGATREYKKEFMDNWLRLLQAAAFEDRTACAELSRSLGYLTGEEHEVRSSPTYFHPTRLLTHQTQIMLDTHIDSMILLASPFKSRLYSLFRLDPGLLGRPSRLVYGLIYP
jgi:aarF domain-containing kinase